MLLSDFDYELPPELIAQHPPAERGQSRLLVIRRDGGPADGRPLLQHRVFADLPEYLRAGDCLVLNDTRVIPGRLVGRRATGGQVELLLLRQVGERDWEALGKPARRLRVGECVTFGPDLAAEIIAAGEEGLRTVRLQHDGPLLEVLDRLGQMPLPPYIHREAPESEDKSRYQTVYAAVPGAAAAPTAGLHFTKGLLRQIEAIGVRLARLTLHVGLGTFRPIQVQRLEDHRMHAEWYEVSPGAAATINAARQGGGRVIAAGTTVVRTLETVADETGVIHAGSGMTELFISPGYQFRAVDGMLTNFHLPRSSLLVMVSAFAGRERVLAAYVEAVRQGYRFYSYGDATLMV
ncbi:tRNA preQ1(34) S-adenosylmethionine ribosyltransferase-isomerase QueA [bacterium]|nr:tRNA preQ1(34) S-adenosylmethionine ribosyltransferase-isomerase QueA [bacterium]